MAKDNDYKRLIHSARWVKLRREILSRTPLCEMCKSDGRVTAATEVHHHRPVEYAVGYDEKCRLMFDPNNLRALCHDCHVKAHIEMGRSGKEATKRRTAEHVATTIRRFFGE